MTGQLIYRTDKPEAIEWLAGFFDREAAKHAALNEFAEDLTSAYGGVDGNLRQLKVMLGLVGGFLPASDIEPAPVGWVRDDRWQGFIPDTTSDVGKLWQRRIDELPSTVDAVDPDEVGIPAFATVTFPDGSMSQFQPVFHLGIDRDAVFVVWDVREIMPAIEAAMQKANARATWGWEPMLRSAWYARIEEYEARGALEAIGHV